MFTKNEEEINESISLVKLLVLVKENTRASKL